MATTGGKGATSAAVGPATSSAAAAGGGFLSSKFALILAGTLLLVIVAAVVVPCTVLLLHPQASKPWVLPSPRGLTPIPFITLCVLPSHPAMHHIAAAAPTHRQVAAPMPLVVTLCPPRPSWPSMPPSSLITLCVLPSPFLAVPCLIISDHPVCSPRPSWPCAPRLTCVLCLQAAAAGPVPTSTASVPPFMSALTAPATPSPPLSQPTVTLSPPYALELSPLFSPPPYPPPTSAQPSSLPSAGGRPVGGTLMWGGINGNPASSDLTS